ncbi:MAG: hypothetical protein R3B47_05030 [Bacteroidia bacterium]
MKQHPIKEDAYKQWLSWVDLNGNKPQKRQTDYWSQQIQTEEEASLALKGIMEYCQRFEQEKMLNPDRTKRYIYNNTTPYYWRALGPTGTSATNFDDGKGIGIINRICFDSAYHFGPRKIMYACSSRGGVWRGELFPNNPDPDEVFWTPFGTDEGLPFTNVSDVFSFRKYINPILPDQTSPEYLFVATGGTEWNGPTFNPDRYGTFTHGVYVGLVNNQSNSVQWLPIHNWPVQGADPNNPEHFMRFFTDHTVGDGNKYSWGTCQKITARLNPNDPNKIQVFVATTKGILRNDDALNFAYPSKWELEFEGADPLSTTTPPAPDNEFRNILFKPQKGHQVIYASGRDIYKKSGGVWVSLTGPQTGLDLAAEFDGTTWTPDPSKPNEFVIEEVHKINIAVSENAPEKLFAYIIGIKEKYSTSNTPKEGYLAIYEYDENRPQTTRWEKLFDRRVSERPGGFSANASDWRAIISGRIGLAVDPTNANGIYFGGNVVFGSNDIHNVNVKDLSYYWGPGVHADILCLEFPPAPPQGVSFPFRLYCGHDGGISVKTTNAQVQSTDWVPVCNGLQVSRSHDFDDSYFEEYLIINALQDCGTYHSSGSTNDQEVWNRFSDPSDGKGDGYGAHIGKTLFNPQNQAGWREMLFYRNNDEGFFYFGSFPRPSASCIPCTSGTKLDDNNLPKDPVMYLNGFNGRVYNAPPTELQKSSSYRKTYLALSEICRIDAMTNSTNDVDYTLVSDIGKEVYDRTHRQPTAIAIAPDNPGAIYLAIATATANIKNEYPDEPNSVHPEILFRAVGHNGGCQNCTDDAAGRTIWQSQQYFESITGNLLTAIGAANVNWPPGGNLTHLPNITGIAVDPLDHERIWISFSGFHPGLKVWHSDDGGDTWQNADSNTNPKLDNLPVFGIVYQKGSDDRLFIATDAGVYTKTATTDWERFGEKLPRASARRITINYCAAKLRVATWGRGIWETDLPEMEPNKLLDEYVISPTDPWVYDSDVPNEIEVDKLISFDRNIRVKSGVTFTIRGTLSMPAEGRIIVEPGAKLHVDGGTITNFCGETWYGIFAGGDKNVSQQDPTTGIPPDHAWVLIENGAHIEYARDGIHNYDEVVPGSGGIIQATNSTFYNNRRSVAMVQYNSPTGAGDYSYFENCIFEVSIGDPGTLLMTLEYDPFMAHVRVCIR